MKVSAVNLLLVVLLVLLTVSYYVLATASASAAEEDKSKQLFLKYEKLAWHYSYQFSEKQNMESFEKWWCLDSPDDFCMLAKNPDFIFMMRYFEQHREAILWDLTQQVPQLQILATHIKYIVSKDFAEAANVDSTFSTPWKSYVSWSLLTFHFNFSKTEAQNSQAFQKWLCDGNSWDPVCNSASGNLSSLMWFYELHRDDVLSARAVVKLGHSVDKPEIQGWLSVNYQCAIGNNSTLCNEMTTPFKDDSK